MTGPSTAPVPPSRMSKPGPPRVPAPPSGMTKPPTPGDDANVRTRGVVRFQIMESEQNEPLKPVGDVNDERVQPVSEPSARLQRLDATIVAKLENSTKSQRVNYTPHPGDIHSHPTRSTTFNTIVHKDSGTHGHGHGGTPTWASATASGVINFLLMFGLCCAYGMIMFDESNAQHRAIGVKLNLCTAMLFGLLLAGLSQVKVAIGGPDLTPVVFLGGFIDKISVDIAEQLDLDHPLGRRLGAASSADAPTFCIGQHLAEHVAACGDYQLQVVATTIFAVAVSSAALSLTFFIMGRAHLLRYASFVPTCVIEAFLACIGYKVFKKAIYFCKYEPRQFVPAAFVGVTLYFLKAYHIGNPVITIPTILFVPLALFYAATYMSGSSIGEETEWMFPKIANADFWQIWASIFLDGGGHINFKAWTKTVMDLIVMVIVCFLDCMIMMVFTESKLPVKFDKNEEMRLCGMGNIFTALCGSSVGYAQPKFNLINYGILGGLDRRGGLVYAVLCGVTFFSTIEHFNFLPRFFLGALLFFAGSGYIVENLWGSRAFLSVVEWCQVLIILAVFIVFQDLLYAVIVGGMLTCIDFIVTCARVPCTVEAPGTYFEFSPVRRAPLLKAALSHALARQLLVVRLQGEVFYAAAQPLVSKLRDKISHEASNPDCQRMSYLIFDLSLVYGMDASTGKLLRKLVAESKRCGVTLLYTGARHALKVRLIQQKLVASDKQLFLNVAQALEFIEDTTLDQFENFQGLWIDLHASFARYNTLMTQQYIRDPLREVFTMESMRRGCPWRFCEGLRLHRHRTLLWAPGEEIGLFLVNSGAVAFYKELPGQHQESGSEPLAIYRGGWFMNAQGLLNLPTQYYAVAYEDGDVLYWSPKSWAKMSRERPRMAEAMSKQAMKQMALEMARMDPEKLWAKRPLPVEVSARLARIRVARSLHSFGFFDTCGADGDELTCLPKLPTSLRQDLRAAFNIFTGSCESDQDKRLQRDSVGDALMISGILYCTDLQNESDADTSDPGVDFAEFEGIAHEAAQMRLAPHQVTTLEGIFTSCDKDQSGSIDEEELADIISRVFVRENLTTEEIHSLFDEWLEAGMQHFDKETFIAFVARFAKLHEQDWHLYTALKDLFGDTVFDDDGAPIDASTLKRVCQPLLTDSSVDHLVFMTAWNHGEQVSLRDIVSVLLMPPWERKPPLPTELVTDEEGSRAAFTARPITKTNSNLSSTLIEEAEWDESPTRTGLSGSLKLSMRSLSSTGSLNVRQKINELLEDPSSSPSARIIWLAMMLLIFCSILALVFEYIFPNDDIIYAEGVITAIFTIEYILRLLSANAFGRPMLKWAVQPETICDLVAIIPFYVLLALGKTKAAGDSIMLRCVRLIRLVRLIRPYGAPNLHSRCPIFGPIAIVLLIIWSIYLTSSAK